MTKQSIKPWFRSYFSRRRKSISEKNRRLKSQKIARLFLNSSFYKRASVIACFVDFGFEVQTRSIIEAAWRAGKTVLIPDTRAGFSRPTFVAYRKGDSLHQTKYGPRELVQSKPVFPVKKIDVVLVPGLGFDARGYRLGYGGGVYDRLLKKTNKATFVGLFFAEQELAFIPAEKHDLRLHAVVTD